MEFTLPVWALLLLSFYQQYTGVEAQNDIYIGLNKMGRVFSRGCQQFAVLTVKKQGVRFNANTLPNQVENWCEGLGASVFQRGKYMAAIPGRGHSEFKMLSNQKETIKDWIDEIDGQVDLMLFTYNAPCCLSTGRSVRDPLGDRIRGMSQNRNHWQGCDAASCSGVIYDFIQGKTCKTIRISQ